jgi:hypothetical protein
MGMTPGAKAARLGRWAAGLAWALWTLTVLGLVATAWLDRLLRQAGAPELTALPASGIPTVAAAVSAVTVGAVLATRRPHHPVGWLLVGLGLSSTAHDLTYSYARYGLVAHPGSLPGAAYLAGLNNGLVLSWICCASFVMLLTPTGRLPSPRWRRWAGVTVAAAVVWLLGSVVYPQPLYPEYPEVGNPLAVPGLPRGVLDVAQPAAGVVVLVSLVVAAVSLLGRLRRARGTERQQLRWLAWGAALAAVALVAAIASLALDSEVDLLNISLGVCAAVLPLATGAAILRYRLYDIDRIISRTLAWGLLTMLLAGGYAAVILMLGLLLGRDSPLVVAAATLAVAAVFQPARRRLQQAVDRRFNRRRHDAAQAIQGFSDHLREQVDLDSLTGELLAVVEETMQPTHASLWLRPQPWSAATGTVMARQPP